jgi:hypothetical protein
MLIATLGKQQHSSKTVFVECETRHIKTLRKEDLPSVKLLVKCGVRQRTINSRLYLTIVNYTECQESTLDKVMSLSSICSAKYIIFFFFRQSFVVCSYSI